MMKFTVDELKKKFHQEPTFETTVDVSDFLPEDEDILSVSSALVKGEIDIENDEYYHFDLAIKATLTVACARTLKPVDLDLDFTVVETFSHDEKDEYRQIEGITIDLLPVIWSNIYLEKPMRVIHPDHVDDERFPSSEEWDKKKKRTRPELKELEKYKS